MSDRELVESAAKAAGIKGYVLGGGDLIFEKDGNAVYWNPLTDDGDALRLAVKLRISVDMGAQYVFGVADRESGSGMCECWNDNSYAATRRAIVRAAAEIGKAMP